MFNVLFLFSLQWQQLWPAGYLIRVFSFLVSTSGPYITRRWCYLVHLLPFLVFWSTCILAECVSEDRALPRALEMGAEKWTFVWDWCIRSSILLRPGTLFFWLHWSWSIKLISLEAAKGHHYILEKSRQNCTPQRLAKLLLGCPLDSYPYQILPNSCPTSDIWKQMADHCPSLKLGLERWLRIQNSCFSSRGPEFST